jgi:hypothetical protein
MLLVECGQPADEQTSNLAREFDVNIPTIAASTPENYTSRVSTRQGESMKRDMLC